MESVFQRILGNRAGVFHAFHCLGLLVFSTFILLIYFKLVAVYILHPHLTFTILFAHSADDSHGIKIVLSDKLICFLIFPRKQELTFHEHYRN